MIIVKMVFGSCLYGTNTPNSDIDYKGIFLPDINDVFLGNIPKSIINNTKKNSNVKNTKDDVDEEFYSLHHFIKLASKGETIAIDMLHASDDMVLEKNHIWDEIRKNRSKFYTKKLKGFIGYILKQVAKYNFKGSRLNACKKFMEFLEQFDENTRLREVWNDIPHVKHIRPSENSPNGIRQINVVGKTIQETVKCGYAYDIVNKYYNEYGHRAMQAYENKNIDYKAVSHAVRYCLQIEELVKTGDIIFPLKDADFIRDIKQGKYNFVKEIQPYLENKVDEVMNLLEKSNFPEKTDNKFWDCFIIENYNNLIKRR